MKTWEQLRHLHQHTNKNNKVVMMMMKKKQNNDKKEIAKEQQRASPSTVSHSCDDSVTSPTTSTSDSTSHVSSSLMHTLDSLVIENDLVTLRKILLQQQQGQGDVDITGDYVIQALGTAVAEGNVEACRLLFSFISLNGKEKYFVNENHLGEDCLVHLASMMRHLYTDDDGSVVATGDLKKKKKDGRTRQKSNSLAGK